MAEWLTVRQYASAPARARGVGWGGAGAGQGRGGGQVLARSRDPGVQVRAKEMDGVVTPNSLAQDPSKRRVTESSFRINERGEGARGKGGGVRPFPVT